MSPFERRLGRIARPIQKDARNLGKSLFTLDPWKPIGLAVELAIKVWWGCIRAIFWLIVRLIRGR